MMRKLGLISISLTFLLAGVGMLLQLPVDNGPGNFFENVNQFESDWILSHVILIFSVVFMLPAGDSLFKSLTMKGPKILGGIALVLLAPTSIFLAGQYAIDFVAPISAQIGSEAITAYNKIDDTAPASIMFYGLSNLSILMLMLLSISTIWNKLHSKIFMILLILNWVLVLIGNLIDPMFQRIMICSLAFLHIPYIKSNLDMKDH